ncbi:uncharacterized protein N7529_005016 [Penicillium soppii]|uniref:uncharacterized protein n=1 Tax=Penicillium soppii TaxID=69789 RepID=UPI0025477D8B|nr:uncharacterized protein N7529_005016 [Penicillium soppii]KAJ5872663.1 hypothetical protein N7529_005016 [Penicillium soppii]
MELLFLFFPASNLSYLAIESKRSFDNPHYSLDLFVHIYYHHGKINNKKSNTDIFMSIKPEHMRNIASRSKNHEYRSYLLPSNIQRIWFYTSSPVQCIEYVAHISQGKRPGDVPEDGGIGNIEFNESLKLSGYGYEILSLWKINEPISLKKAIEEGFLKGPPQKYCWVCLEFLEKYPLDQLNQLFSTVG